MVAARRQLSGHRSRSEKLEALLARDKDIVSVTSYVGSGARFYLPLDQQLQHLNYAQLMLMTRDEHVREQVKKRLEKLFDNDFPMCAAG